MGSVFEILSERTPIKSKLTKYVEKVCNWKGSERNYHKHFDHIKPATTNQLQCHWTFEEYQVWVSSFVEKSNIFKWNFPWEYCLKFKFSLRL